MLTARDAALRAVKALRSGSDFREETRRCDDARERSLADAIASSVARNLAFIDAHIARVSSTKADKLEPVTRDILRVAVSQLMFMRGIPPSAAVNEAVKQAKRRTKNAAPFVNAVLRRITREGFPELVFADETERLAVTYSHPAWYVEALVAAYGAADAETALRAGNEPPPVYCAVNTLRSDIGQVARSLEREGVTVRMLTAPQHMFVLDAPGDITRFSAFRDGLFYVQDPGAYRVAEFCGVKPGDTVLDLCAAPGGKSFALANIMRGAGRIIAFDTPGRAKLMADGLRRLRIDCIEVRPGDALIRDDRLLGLADVALVDAPCSGFGAIRKKPEIRYKKQSDIAGLPDIQYGMMSNAAAYVKRGGRLVYATCTLLPEENERVAKRFLEANKNYREVARETLLPSADNDGFFMLAAERTDA